MPSCPVCRRWLRSKDEAVEHINKYHADQFAAQGVEDACQLLYKSTHGTIQGQCMCCRKPTGWNYKTGKPYKMCNDPKCREILAKRAEDNLMKARGITKATLMSDMEHQKEMQQKRPTAGHYKFSDGGYVAYLSKLEEKFLRFCDTILELHSCSVQESPEVFTYYDKKAERDRQYIPDYYLPDYNLLVEIKDGGEHPNTNPAFVEETKYKVQYKDDAMRKQTKYNFIKIVDSNYGPFVELLYRIVHKQIDEDKGKASKNMVIITETACTDLDEEMDFVHECGTHDQCYIMIETDKATGRVTRYGISESARFDRVYMNQLNATAPLTEAYAGELLAEDQVPTMVETAVDTYKYIGDTDLTEAINAIITAAMDQLELDPMQVLRENGIMFDDGKQVRNNNMRMMDFIRTPIVK